MRGGFKNKKQSPGARERTEEWRRGRKIPRALSLFVPFFLPLTSPESKRDMVSRCLKGLHIAGLQFDI